MLERIYLMEKAAEVMDRLFESFLSLRQTSGWDAEVSLAAYFRFYNEERIHQALGYRTPQEVYRERSSSDRQPDDEKQHEIARNNLIAG